LCITLHSPPPLFSIYYYFFNTSLILIFKIKLFLSILDSSIMPLRLRHILDRLPLPSLRYYTLISTSILVGNIFYFHHLIQTNLKNETISNETIFFSDAKPFSLAYMETLLSIIISQSLSLLILVNAIYCSFGLFGKYIQEFIFGELRLVELQRIKDKFWNYAFYKFCFLFGVLGLENLNELVLWISWFSVLSFALLFCQLAKDRYELLSVSASIRRQPLVKILCLLVSLLILCCALLSICFLIGLKYGGLSIFFFMLAETILLTLDTCYLLFKYIFQYYIFEQQEQNPLTTSNEYRSYMIYYMEFLYHIITLIIDITHHLQMLFYHQTFMSMSSLIFFMQLKPLFNELTQRLKRHKSYRNAMIRMEKKYPLLTKYDLEQKYLKQNHVSSLEEICSICWEKFEKARCLPCGHLFHQNCLRSWLEQDTTCPICRLSLQEDNTQQIPPAPVPPAAAPNFLLWPSLTLARLATNVHGLADGAPPRPPRNHLIRFDGSRYSSWLPSFSIEINHNFPFRLGRARLTGVQLTSMVQNVQQVFPQVPQEIILADLQRTQSIDMTIENIIDHRIRIEPQQTHQQQDTSGSDESSYLSTSASSSEAGEPIDSDLLSDAPRTTQTDELIDNNDHDAFTWPLDPQLPLVNRKQQLISHMRRRFLDRERRLHPSSSRKSDLLSDN
jgi:autocrine motility factor receptor